MKVLFGGTFDPFHLGHEHVVRTLLNLYPIQTFWIVPTHRNPHKQDSQSTPANHRLKITETAVQGMGDPRVRVLDWEIARPGPSYTVDTLERFNKELAGDEIPALVFGNEVFGSFPKWKQPMRILELAHGIVIRRTSSGRAVSDVLANLGIRDATIDPSNATRLWHSNHSRFIDQREIQARPFSATALRKELQGPDMPQGIQRSVWLYIKENGLYAV